MMRNSVSGDFIDSPRCFLGMSFFHSPAASLADNGAGKKIINRQKAINKFNALEGICRYYSPTHIFASADLQLQTIYKKPMIYIKYH